MKVALWLRIVFAALRRLHPQYSHCALLYLNFLPDNQVQWIAREVDPRPDPEVVIPYGVRYVQGVFNLVKEQQLRISELEAALEAKNG